MKYKTKQKVDPLEINQCIASYPSVDDETAKYKLNNLVFKLIMLWYDTKTKKKKTILGLRSTNDQLDWD